jgi:hypothetical protein
MPVESDEMERQAINILLSQIGKEDRLGVVSFGMSPHLERIPTSSNVDEFNEFRGNGSRDASNLHDAIDSALSIIPNGVKSRLLVISDGRWTGESPDHLISRLVQRGIPVDYRVVERSHVGDVAILAIDAPEKVLPGEVFKVTGMVYVPVDQNIGYKLTCNGVEAATGIRPMNAGSNRIDFMLKAGVPGTMQCDLEVKRVIENEADNGNDSGNSNENLDQNNTNKTDNSETSKLKVTFAGDPVPENNFARKLVGVEGDKPLLILVPRSDSGVVQSKLAEVLRDASLKVDVSDGSGIVWSLGTLSRYSGIIFENVPASQIGSNGMSLISEWVKETGAGLMFTGGKNAYSLGGYYKSPFEQILPVSMELRKEHRKLAIAVAILMDCSGSMGMMVPGGKIKMDLADAGAAEVLNILTPMDEVAVSTCDTSVRKIVPLKFNSDTKNDTRKILAVGPGGGGIFAYTGLKTVTAELASATAETKHVILFTDADDTEEPGDYVKLLMACRDVGMTCSVIALGTPADSTADFCRDIARVGGGNIYFTEKPEELPRLFAQDTFTIARSAFLDESTPFHFSGGMLTLSDAVFQNPLPLGGYNLCYLKEKAILSAVTEDEYNAPIIASWQVGLGRVLCYMGQVDGKFTGEIAGWGNYNLMLASLGRWTAGKTNLLPDNMMLTQTLDNGDCQIRLHLDPESESTITSTPDVTMLIQKADGTTETRKLQLKWLEPDMLGITVPLAGDEIVQATLLLAEGGEIKPYSLPPVCAPNSPEFRPPDQMRNSGETLRQLAATTGGVERIELPRIWQDIPKSPRFFDISAWLIYLAILCIVIEIFQRRTGWITSWSKRVIARFSRKTTAQNQNVNAKTTDDENKDKDNDQNNRREISLSIFQRFKLRRKTQKILHSNQTTPNNSTQTLPTQQPAAPTTQNQPKTSDTSTSSSNVIDALNKAKQSSKSRTKK